MPASIPIPRPAPSWCRSTRPRPTRRRAPAFTRATNIRAARTRRVRPSSAASPIWKAARRALPSRPAWRRSPRCSICSTSGDHVVATDDLYGGSFRLFERVRRRSAGLDFDFVDFERYSPRSSARSRPDTKLIWIETPTNPLLKLADLAAIAALARKRGILTVVDNTFASPYVQRPLELGCDIVVHSTTKYLNGHSDIVGGVAVVGDNRELAEQMRFLQNAVGAIAGPFDSLSRASRLEDSGAPHGAALCERARDRALAGSAQRRRARDLSRPRKPSAACAGQAADERLRRHGHRRS